MLAELKKRLQALNMQKARYGIAVDPSITTEAETLETVISLIERINIHRNALTVLLQQRDHFGASTASHVHGDIANRRSEITSLRALTKHHGYAVPSSDVDQDQFTATSEPKITLANPAYDTVATKLNQIDQLVREIRAILR